MKYLSKKPIAVVLSALTLPLASGALFLTSNAAQADPPTHAPAYGYRYKQKKDKGGWKHDRDRDNRDDRYEDDRGTSYDDNNGNVIDRDRDGLDDRYEDDRGTSYDDRDDDNNDYNNGNYNNNDNVRTVTVSGIVTGEAQNDRRFTIRTNSGQTYTVRTAQNATNRIDVGDRVSVTGRINERNVIRAQSVRVTNNGGNNGNNGNYGQRINFTGTIVSFQTNSRFTIRRDGTNSVYTVQSRDNEQSSFNRGDRARVVGTLSSNNVVQATDVDRISGNGGNDNGYGQRIDFVGTIVSFQTNSRFTIRRDGTNSVYTVQSRDNEQSSFNRGDRARVVGTLSSNNVVQATDVDRISGNGSSNNGGRQSVNFSGTIVGNENGALIVRGDNGRIYRVLYRSTITTGTRVRVQADVVNGVITATDINRL